MAYLMAYFEKIYIFFDDLVRGIDFCYIFSDTLHGLYSDLCEELNLNLL